MITDAADTHFSPIPCPPPPTDRPPRILVCGVQIPFVTGGAESHLESIHRELKARGYESDIVRLPFKWYPPRQIINDALAWRFLDVTHSYGLPVDMVIATRFPSYVVRHPRKIAWVFHQHRQAYDLLNTEFTDFKDTPDDDHARGLLYDIDRTSLLECRHIFANSKNVAARMKRFLDIDSEPLYHPPPLAGRYRCETYENAVLSVGRLELNKRVDLILRGMAASKGSFELWVAGRGPQADALEKLAAELGLTERVRFFGFVDDETLLDLYARCGAVIYTPLDEDYGYVTLEALLSKKAVITTSDAGGVLEFVSEGVSGYVADPDPASVAAAMDRWASSDNKGRSLGEAGYAAVSAISWDHVIDTLTAPLRISSETNS